MLKCKQIYRSNNQANPKESLQKGKHGRHSIWKLLGDNAKTGGEKSGVANGLDDSDKDAKPNKDLAIVDLV